MPLFFSILALLRARFNSDVVVRGYCIRASAALDSNDIYTSLTVEERSAVLRLHTERLQTLAPSTPIDSRSLQTQATQDTSNAVSAQSHVAGSLGGQTTATTASDNQTFQITVPPMVELARAIPQGNASHAQSAKPCETSSRMLAMQRGGPSTRHITALPRQANYCNILTA